MVVQDFLMPDIRDRYRAGSPELLSREKEVEIGKSFEAEHRNLLFQLQSSQQPEMIDFYKEALYSRSPYVSKMNEIRADWDKLMDLTCYQMSRSYTRAAAKNLRLHLQQEKDKVELALQRGMNGQTEEYQQRVAQLEEKILKIDRACIRQGKDNEQLVNPYFGRVFKYAQEVHPLVEEYLWGASFDDLVQAGMEGLLRVADRFDYRKEKNFGSMLRWPIKGAMFKVVAENSSATSLSRKASKEKRHYFQAQSRLMEELGREPTDFEMAQHLGLVQQSKAFQARTEIALMNGTHISLDENVFSNDPDSPTLKDRVIDQTLIPADKSIELQELAPLESAVESVLSTLRQREEQVVRMHFGIGHPQTYSLEEIGKVQAVSKARIHQIEKDSLGKLMHPSRRQVLEKYL